MLYWKVWNKNWSENKNCIIDRHDREPRRYRIYDASLQRLIRLSCRHSIELDDNKIIISGVIEPQKPKVQTSNESLSPGWHGDDFIFRDWSDDSGMSE